MQQKENAFVHKLFILDFGFAFTDTICFSLYYPDK